MYSYRKSFIRIDDFPEFPVRPFNFHKVSLMFNMEISFAVGDSQSSPWLPQ